MWAGGLFVESEIRQTLKASETELRISVTVPRTLNATRKKNHRQASVRFDLGGVALNRATNIRPILACNRFFIGGYSKRLLELERKV